MNGLLFYFLNFYSPLWKFTLQNSSVKYRHIKGIPKLTQSPLGYMCFIFVGSWGEGVETTFLGNSGVCSFCRICAKFQWAPDFVEFVFGRFAHFYIAIAYSNSTFCGTWTPSFCEFTWKLSKFQQNEHTPGSTTETAWKIHMKHAKWNSESNRGKIHIA